MGTGVRAAGRRCAIHGRGIELRGDVHFDRARAPLSTQGQTRALLGKLTMPTKGLERVPGKPLHPALPIR